MPIKKDEETLAKNTPHIVVGTPGRLLALGRTGQLKLKNIKFFVLDECDKMIGDAGESEFDLIKIIYFLLDMRHDVQEIFKMTPQEKQVMMFSATLPRELRVVCKKFMQGVSHLLKKSFCVVALLENTLRAIFKLSRPSFVQTLRQKFVLYILERIFVHIGKDLKDFFGIILSLRASYSNHF